MTLPRPLAIFGPALLLLAFAGPGHARDRGAVPAATPNGEPRDCLSITDIRATHVHGDGVIDFDTGRQVYRNTLPNACPGLGFEERFAYETSLSRLCSTDIITVLTTAPLMRGASCGLGRFQPVTLAHR